MNFNSIPYSKPSTQTKSDIFEYSESNSENLSEHSSNMTTLSKSSQKMKASSSAGRKRELSNVSVDEQLDEINNTIAQLGEQAKSAVQSRAPSETGDWGDKEEEEETSYQPKYDEYYTPLKDNYTPVPLCITTSVN